MKRAHLISALLLAGLSACGGDSDSPPVTIPTQPGGGAPPNAPPAFTSAATASVPEGSSLAYQAVATDPDGDTVTISISGGADAALFSIDGGGKLSFVAAPSFAAPADANRDNVYEVTLRASDGKTSVNLNLGITVTRVAASFTVRRIANGFNGSLQVAAVPGQPSQIYVAEKRGRVYLLDTVTGTRTLLLTLPDVSTDNERGLVGMAVGKAGQGMAASPTGLFLLVTAADGTVEVRTFVRQADGTFAADANQPVLVSVPHGDHSNHNGGWIEFGPDGQLYVGIGDGGAGNADFSSQNANLRLGKILRLKRIPGAGATGPFWQASPDNASAGDPFVFALGLRNPFRAAFEGNDIIVADVGEGAIEEVSLITTASAGVNLGWPYMEGTRVNKGSVPGGLTGPALQYGHGSGPLQGGSIIGGRVYHGPISNLDGQYIFADFISKHIWSVAFDRLKSGPLLDGAGFELRDSDFVPDAGSINQPVAFGTDGAGNLYIVDLDGEIFRVEPGS